MESPPPGGFSFLLLAAKRKVAKPVVIEKIEHTKHHDSEHKDNFYQPKHTTSLAGDTSLHIL